MRSRGHDCTEYSASASLNRLRLESQVAHPLFQGTAWTVNRRLAKFCLNGGPYNKIKRTIERWEEKVATKVSKLVEALNELSAVSPLGLWHSVKASSLVLLPGL
jgi:hypothetical protein